MSTKILRASGLPPDALMAIDGALQMVRDSQGQKAMIANLSGSWVSAKGWSRGRVGELTSVDLAAVLAILGQYGTDIMAADRRVAAGFGRPSESAAGQKEARERMLDAVLVATKLLAEALYEATDRLSLERAAAKQDAGIPKEAIIILNDRDGEREVDAKKVVM